jgi:hypothetical protein
MWWRVVDRIAGWLYVSPDRPGRTMEKVQGSGTPVIISTALDYCVTHGALNHGNPSEGGALSSCRFRQLFYFENPMDEHTLLWADEIGAGA